MTGPSGLQAERSTEEQLLVILSRFVGAGFVFFFLVSIPTMGLLSAVTRPWWTPVALVCVFGPGFALVVVSVVRPRIRVLRALAAASAVGYLLACSAWLPGWTGGHLEDGFNPWFSTFSGLASLAAVLAARPAWAFAHLTVAVLTAQVIAHTLHEPLIPGQLAADILYTYGFSVVFLAAAVTAMRTARLVDRTRESAYAQASDAAIVQARHVERRRFDGLIHDQVLSTLLAASRSTGIDQSLVAQSDSALAELDSLRADAGTPTEFLPGDAAAHLRTTAAAVDPTVRIEIRVEVGPDHRIPADPIRTVGAAMGEAMRNSVRHAGSDALRTVSAVVSPTELTVTVADDGVGFDPATVPAHRLGVRVSILDRMWRLPGGAVDLRTAPGQGTVVTLRWQMDAR